VALGWAIIGAGMHPQQKVAPAIGLTPDSELIAVLSRDQGRADTFAEAHDAQVGYSNIDDLLADSRVDAVFVASPNAMHLKHTEQAAVNTSCPRSRWLPPLTMPLAWCRSAERTA
jgi:1,5-anhydro-D-fructose reductase (1,5-anhydro-D-mannitol-forming)